MAESNSTSGVEYRAIPGFPGYRVGSDGTIWSEWERCGNQYTGRPWACRARWRLLRLGDCRGYKLVVLRSGVVKRTLSVHRLVLVAFVGPRPDGCQARHLDGNKDNNSLSNLRWGTAKENCADKERHGRALIGERNHQAKLTLWQAREIVRSYDAGERPYLIAKRLGIKKWLVYAITKGGRWRKAVTAAET